MGLSKKFVYFCLRFVNQKTIKIRCACVCCLFMLFASVFFMESWVYWYLATLEARFLLASCPPGEKHLKIHVF